MKILIVLGGMGLQEFLWTDESGYQRRRDNSGEFGITVRKATSKEIEIFGENAPFKN